MRSYGWRTCVGPARPRPAVVAPRRRAIAGTLERGSREGGWAVAHDGAADAQRGGGLFGGDGSPPSLGEHGDGAELVPRTSGRPVYEPARPPPRSTSSRRRRRRVTAATSLACPRPRRDPDARLHPVRAARRLLLHRCSRARSMDRSLRAARPGSVGPVRRTCLWRGGADRRTRRRLLVRPSSSSKWRHGTDHAAYLADCLAILGQDARALVAACGHAQRTIDYVTTAARWPDAPIAVAAAGLSRTAMGREAR